MLQDSEYNADTLLDTISINHIPKYESLKPENWLNGVYVVVVVAVMFETH